MYYIGLTHWGHQRFYGTAYRPVFVAGRLGPAEEELGPAEAVSVENFLQEKCKLGSKEHTAYRKYHPEKRDLSYRPSLGSSPALLPIYSVYVACMRDDVTKKQENDHPAAMSAISNPTTKIGKPMANLSYSCASARNYTSTGRSMSRIVRDR